MPESDDAREEAMVVPPSQTAAPLESGRDRRYASHLLDRFLPIGVVLLLGIGYVFLFGWLSLSSYWAYQMGYPLSFCTRCSLHHPANSCRI